MNYLYPLGLSLLLITTAAQAQDWQADKPKFMTDTIVVDTDTTTSVALGFSPELDKRYGFRGLRFETPLQQVKGLKFIANREGKAIYEKISENRVLGNARLKKILYCFYRGQLADIIITATGPTNATEVTKVFMEAYGIPYQPEDEEYSGDGKFYWRGEKATILLSTPSDDIDFYVFISSVPMDEKQKHDSELRVKRAAEKL